jgi:peptide/nickel transport system permease protein
VSTAEPVLQARVLSSVGRRVGRHDAAGVAAVVIVAILVFLAIFGPYVAPQDPNAVNLSDALAGPSSAHLLGTDALGRDLLSRIIIGARISLLGPLLVVLGATAIGTAVAITSAWKGGWVDTTIARGLDVVFAFPGLLLAILAVTFFGVGLTAPVIALAIAYVPYIARVVRSAALRERRLGYIESAMTQGSSGWSICRRHLLPNVLPLVIAQATIFFAYALVDLAALSFLGLGVQPPTSDWGSMVADGMASVLRGHPQESLFAGAMIVITVVAFTVLAERISEYWEQT